MRWLLERYEDGQRKLRGHKTGDYRETYLSIGSGHLGKDRAKTLRRLRMLVGWGFIVEPDKNTRDGSKKACRFYLPTKEQVDEIYKEAQGRHEAVGYIPEVKMDEIK